MRRSTRALILLFALPLGAAVAWSARGPAGAQPTSAPAARTPEEQEALDLLSEEQMVTARTKAEEVLARNPHSLVGHYVVGVVLHQAEGSLARAMYHLGRAREIYETTWAASTRPADAPWELHRDLLYRVQSLAGEMELHDYRLQVLGYHDYLYDPDLLAQHAWPLMHLGKYEEARQYAQRAMESRDEWQRSAGLNALCALEGEAGRREPFHEACIAALDNARGRGVDEEERGAFAVHAFNAAQAARAALRFDEAEALALEGTRRLELTPANPWRLLARHRLEKGELTQAVEAVREMQRWRARQPAYLRDQDRAETDAAFAELLLVAGESDVGLRAIDRAIAQPDRRGLTSSDPEQALGAHALLRRALARTRAERRAEEASWSGALARLGHAATAPAARLESWPDDERIAGVLSDDERLVRTLRPYVRGGIEPLPPWLVGDLVQVLGAGVVSVALHRARAQEGPETPVAPFYDGLQAEVALAQGDERLALDLSRRALDRLPGDQALFRARVAAVGAEAARAAGDGSTMLALYEEAMQKDAGVIRRLGLSLPASVRASGGGLAGEVAALLEASPRLRSGRGFEVRVASVGAATEACLLSPHGARLACAQVDPVALLEEQGRARAAYDEAVAGAREAGVDPATLRAPEPVDPARELARAFHERAFAAPVSLSSADLRSLDGRTTGSADLERERLRGMLEGVVEGAP